MPGKLEIGARLGNYRIEKSLGAGGEAEVFLAEDLILKRPVALKVVGDRSVKAAHGLREARLIASMSHRSIVSVYHVEMYRGDWVIAMEFMADGSLSDVITKNGKIGTVTALRYSYAIADALSHAHLLGVIHRDVKPHNVLLSKQGNVKLADFGLAFQYGENYSSKALTGTPHFMAPEVWEGQEATAKSDLYSLGACLFYMLCATPPFTYSKLAQLEEAHKNETPVVPLTIPAPIAGLIRDCMAKDPDERPADAAALAKRINKLLADFGHSTEFHRTPTRSNSSPSQRKVRIDSTEDTIANFTSLASVRQSLRVALEKAAPFILLHGPVWEIATKLASATIRELKRTTLLETPTFFVPANGSVLGAMARPLGLDKDEVFGLFCDGTAMQTFRTNRDARLVIWLKFDADPNPEQLGELKAIFAKSISLDMTLMVVCSSARSQKLIEGLGEHARMLTKLGLPRLSAEEFETYVRDWPVGLNEVRTMLWSKDSISLLRHLNMKNDDSLDRLVNNAIAIGQNAKMSLITTWCVLGAVEHKGLIQAPEDIREAWRKPPKRWPNKEVQALVDTIRSK